MKPLLWASIAFLLVAAAGCANQQSLWDDPYYQNTTGPQPPTNQRVSGP